MTQTEFEFLKEALGAKNNELLKDIVEADRLMKMTKSAQAQAQSTQETQPKKTKKEKSK